MIGENIIPLRAFKDNYIWTFFDARQLWVVDPGDVAPVIEYLKKSSLRLAGILLTHHHADHSGGIADLLDYAQDIPVWGHYRSSIKYITHPVKEGDEVICSGYSFRVIEIPGHTLDHVAFYGEGSVFCGDTLFSAGCGRVFEGDAQMMYTSLNKILQLDAETKIYCGHEYTLANLFFAQQVEPDNKDIANKIKEVKMIREKDACTLPAILSMEKNINPFLRCTVPAVVAAAEKVAGKKLTTGVDVFHVLREWKNSMK